MDVADLEKLFAPFGPLVSAKVVAHPDGESKGYGFVVYKTAEEATAAITALHDKDVKGQKLHVSLAEKKAGKQWWKSDAPKEEPKENGKGKGKGRGKGKTETVWTVSEKQAVGNLLYGRILGIEPKLARKLTGMLLGTSRTVAVECAASERVLRARIDQCKELLEKKNAPNGDKKA